MATGPHNSLLVSDRALGAGAGGEESAHFTARSFKETED